MTSFSWMISLCWYKKHPHALLFTAYFLFLFPTLPAPSQKSYYCSYKSFKAFSPFLQGPQLQSADRDPQGPGEQQKHAGPESEPQWYRLYPKPAVHQPNRPVVSGPE